MIPDTEEELLLDYRVEEMFPLTDTWTDTAEFLQVPGEQLLRNALFNPIDLNVIDVRGKKDEADTQASVRFLPGHVRQGPRGPRPCEIMIIGKRPGEDEVIRERLFVGPSGEVLTAACKKYGLDTSGAYVSNVLRFIPPDGGKTIRAHHIRDCSALLAHELLIVNPTYILLLGSDAVKWMYGRKATLKSLRGAVLPFRFDSLGKFPARGDNDQLEALRDAHGTSVMVSMHPAAVLADPSFQKEFEADIQSFCRVATGAQSRVVIPVSEWTDVDYRYIDNTTELNELVDELIAAKHTTFAVDCEWAGQSPFEEDSWLRTIQFSWGPGTAAVVILRRCGGEHAFQVTHFQAFDALRRLFDRPDVSLIGHGFRADAVWLDDVGVPAMRRFAFDTMLAQHVLDETIARDLSSMTVRYTDMGRYDFGLNSWLRQHPQPKSRGYGWVPDDVLHPYAAADADATFRIFMTLKPEFDKAEAYKQKFLYYCIEMPASHGINEMESQGLLVDTDRMIDLLWQYVGRKNELLDELRTLIHWDDFNPRSHLQKVKLLFSPPADGGLGLSPIKSTEKPAREWPEVLQLSATEQARINPSVDQESLELLAVDAPGAHQKAAVELLRQFQVIDQVTKNFLRPPVGLATEPDDLVGLDADMYIEGLMGHIARGGRIRTQIDQCKETGRYGSRRPNLQNISKRQEPRYQEIMGTDIPTIRSCFIASPGHVLIEADFRSAEIVTLAYVSGDDNLIADALGPVKLHSKVAVDILGATCGYAEVAKEFPHLYVGAKNINFGIPYQRGAKAISRQVNRETKGAAGMTQGFAQEIIDAWYDRYAMVKTYVESVFEEVTNPPFYLETPYGRRRHFFHSESRSIVAAQHREGVNFRIQSIVADALSKAIVNLWQYRQRNPWCEYRMLLAIHDEIILEVPIHSIGHVMDVVLPECMTDNNWVPELANGKRFNLGIDPDITLRWGETPSRKDLRALGVPERFWPEEKAA